VSDGARPDVSEGARPGVSEGARPGVSDGARPGVTPASVAVRVPGTSANIGPGFDALGIALSIHLLAGVVSRGDHRVVTTGEGAGEVPTDDTNLVWTSLVRFCDANGHDVPDVSLVVHNDLPLERGLGSSSAAIVAGLALGRALTGAAVGDLDLVRMADAVEGHPDNVAPAILGGFVSCTTAADGSLVIRRAQPDPRLAVLVAVPDARQNTKQARAALPEGLDRHDVAIQAGRAVHVAGALSGLWPVAPGAAGDLLHEPPRLEAMAASGSLIGQLRAAGLHAWLSGAGPTVAAAVPAANLEVQGDAIARAEGAGFRASVQSVDLSGAFACSSARCPISGVGGCADCPRTAVC
jgi:homoserine kinase